MCKMNRFRENSQRRVKQRKRQLEKDYEERRKQSLKIIKQKVIIIRSFLSNH